MTHVARPIHSALSTALQADRDSFNQRFRMCALQGTPLDATAFFDHIVTRVDGIVSAVHACFPERTRLVTSELYDVSLDLFRTGFFGQETRLPALDRLWKQVLPHLAPMVARAPQRVAGGLSNALINLAAHGTVRLDDWLGELIRVGGLSQSENELLGVASVLAWRAGMAQLRSAALARLARLPTALAAQALGLVRPPSEDEWQQLRERIALDRWLDPAAATVDSTSDGPCIAHTVGGFRGFGGSFMKPPAVLLHENWLHVHDETSLWRVHADCFGTHLQRIGSAEIIATGRKKAPGRKPAKTAEPKISDDGTLTWDANRQRFAHLASPASQVFDGQVLAITLATSFHVYLIIMSPQLCSRPPLATDLPRPPKRPTAG